ncbi:GGDEF domain-containing protein [Sphingobium jiangsuense]|uniref:Diguanylate cyclase (GGDEF)-like protein/PAS domain S-box-containing protein n=1 Tax=Sphingobium jiangsuense TaxID=870476 RepID=A0A7W6BJA3_9SPHN|nr:EAL domain-containing protein [Sphingobium jiangsuense]MBB3926974.1 diguanylate cyclase (GGDEF)-like protein/PAS domain S-box-containing protein [Sphingobium jiangsuense]GLT02083.1 GGDEF domain-containing protein [Sphingobium jiangsuense]
MKINVNEDFSSQAASPLPSLAVVIGAQSHGPEARLEQAELHAYREALDHVAIVATTDRAGRITDVNRLFCEISGYAREELIGADHRLLNSGHHPSHFFRQMWQTIAQGNVWRADICNRDKKGRLYWVDTTIAPRRDGDGRLVGYVSIRFDITSRKIAEAEVLAELRRREVTENLLVDIIETIPNGLVAYDSQGQLLFCNNAHRKLYDLASCSPARSPMMQSGGRQPPASGPFAPADLPTHLSIGLEGEGMSRPYIQQLDSERWIQIHNRRSESGNLVSIQTDISALKRAQMQIKHQAERDALTGIGNRTILMRRLSNLFRSRSREDRGMAMLMIVDLDDFKLINDRFGHDGGDTLLQHIAERLRASVRRNDTVVRLGGDEFAVLMRDIPDRPAVERIAGTMLGKMQQPVKVGQQTIIPSASIGIALFPKDAKTPGELMKNADLALYQAKLNGRRGYSVYDSMIRRDRKRRAVLIEKLRVSLSRDEVGVALQPQSNLRSGRHEGFEALARWKVGGAAVPPLELISVAEEAGLITQLSYRLIDKALAAMAGFRRDGLSPGTIAFNVVAAQLQEPDFIERLCAMVEAHGLSPQDIEIEVTENVILDRAAGNIAAALKQLHKKGMSIALDDFGTGYASLTHLKQFPIDILKIDRSFISGILNEKDDEIIVRTIISLAHNLGFEVIAEGVETIDQYKQLSNFGCDLVQGYLLARPMSEEESRAYLDSVRRPGFRDLPLPRSLPPDARSAEGPG